MLVNALLVAHIAVLGYWLGSELVINRTFRYVSWSAGMPFDERSRLMDLVMDVDQHVRYALVLQAGLGTSLAAWYGFFPGGPALAWGALVFMAAWLAFVEAAHRLRRAPVGESLARIDRVSRYLLLVLLLGLALSTRWWAVNVPFWLALKLAFFAGVIACGVGIRLALIGYFRTWRAIARDGSTEDNERAMRRGYVRATVVLVLLWLCIGAITYSSLFRPGL
jgi:hypothetical protein